MLEVGDVAGRDLLHLQCRFGLDTLAWARRGARVTGVDFSERAIALARSLAAETGLEATFVCSDVLQLDTALQGDSGFDIEFPFSGYRQLPYLVEVEREPPTYRLPGELDGRLPLVFSLKASKPG